MSDTNDDNKTARIGILCLTMVVLGFFLFCSKMTACQSCGVDKPAPPEPNVCRDSFYEIDTANNKYVNNTVACAPGARAEYVVSPPAPKPGIICHCGPAPSVASSTIVLPPPAAR